MDTQCKRCHVGPLHWQRDKGKWRLKNSKGEVHVCPNQHTDPPIYAATLKRALPRSTNPLRDILIPAAAHNSSKVSESSENIEQISVGRCSK